jgi:hypothetical protein
MLRSHLKSFQNWLTRRPARKPITRKTSLHVEALEVRELMSANLAISGNGWQYQLKGSSLYRRACY